MTGLSLVILVGNAPAPAEVMDAVQELTVDTTMDTAGSFRLRVGTRQTPDGRWPLVASSLFAPLVGVRIGVQRGARPLPTFLFAGHVATQSVVFADTPGGSSMEIGGLDPTALMNLRDRTVAWPNQPDAAIASRILSEHGLIPQVTPTSPVLVEPEGTTVQRGTDIRFLRRLARRNGFDVYTLPQPDTGLAVGYFTAPALTAAPVATLAVRSGVATNLSGLRIAHDMLRPTTVTADALDSRHTGQVATVDSVSVAFGGTTTLSRLHPAPVTRLTGTGLTEAGDLARAAQAAVDRASFAVSAEGTVDASVGPLRPGEVVHIAGAGEAYSGAWLVRRVVHRITEDGGYTQRFSAVRNAVGG